MRLKEEKENNRHLVSDFKIVRTEIKRYAEKKKQQFKLTENNGSIPTSNISSTDKSQK